MKILMVDDSKTMLRIEKNVLQKLGLNAEIVEAYDGEDGWEKYQQDKYDLIMVDWNMPKMTGIELVKKIRAVDKETKIVMVTSESEKSHIIEAIKAGVNQYIVKPFDENTMKRKLQELKILPPD